MTDSATAPATAAANPAPKRNPLDILEDILDNAEAQKEENQAKEEQDKVSAELKAKEDEARRLDLARIEEERSKMSAIGSTPQEQARQAQQQEKIEEAQHRQDEQQGYQILQLGHTKI